MELLDRKMATLRADISEKAAEAAKVYKFNAGAAHPTADSSPETVAAGKSLAACATRRPPIDCTVHELHLAGRVSHTEYGRPHGHALLQAWRQPQRSCS